MNTRNGLSRRLILAASAGLSGTVACAGSQRRTNQDRLRHVAVRTQRWRRQDILGRARDWRDEVNAKGGLLGRQVQFVYYDDQSNPSLVPGIYSKLLDVDKVDLVVSPFATNQIAPAMPIVMQKKMTFMALFGTGVNDEFRVLERYFQILPNGPDGLSSFSLGFFAGLP